MFQKAEKCEKTIKARNLPLKKDSFQFSSVKNMISLFVSKQLLSHIIQTQPFIHKAHSET